MIWVIGYIIIVYVVFFIISKNKEKLHFDYGNSDLDGDLCIAVIMSVFWILTVPILLITLPIYLIYKRYE